MIVKQFLQLTQINIAILVPKGEDIESCGRLLAAQKVGGAIARRQKPGS